MSRPSVDRAALAQLERKDRLLREVILRGGSMTWPGLFERGHKHPTVRLCVRERLLREPTRHHYEITQTGRDTIAQLDHAKWTGAAR
jgi:hypothetical protein